jgi:hypothetical protein
VPIATCDQPLHGKAEVALEIEATAFGNRVEDLLASETGFFLIRENTLQTGMARPVREFGAGEDDLAFRTVEIAKLVGEKVDGFLEFHG